MVYADELDLEKFFDKSKPMKWIFYLLWQPDNLISGI